MKEKIKVLLPEAEVDEEDSGTGGTDQQGL